MKVRQFFSEYRWPLYLVGLLLLAITAQGIMVYFATRPDAPRVQKDYYEKSLKWDAESAVVEASRKLGWTVGLDVPSGAQWVEGMPRPVDLTVKDADGAPVAGLTGRLVAVRPADTRLNGEGAITELPHAPGTYRALVRLDVDGLWELNLDATRDDGLRFVHSQRITLNRGADGDAAKAAGGNGQG